METNFPSFSAIGSGRMRQYSAQKLKNTNNLAVFDHFGIVKYKIFGAPGGFAPWTPTRDLPCTRWGLTAPPDPSWIRE